MELLIGWVEQALQGDRRAREEVSDWCLKQAFRLAHVDMGSTPNRATLAEEIAGEASLKAMTHLDQFQPGTHFAAWLHRIVRNCVRDHFRRGDQALPRPIYQRWVHDFLHAHRAELEVLVQRELGREPSAPHCALLQRIATDLAERTYSHFMRLTYAGRANAVLEIVKQRLRSFVGLEWVPLYQQDEDGDWIAVDLPAADEPEALVMHHDFIDHVNERLAELQPPCRRLLRWYYLDHLSMPDIAHLERLSERTAYRRLERCSAFFRARLLRDDYFAEFAATAR